MSKLDSLANLLQTTPNLEIAVLIGSRSDGTATDQSDWDIAVQWEKQIKGLARLEGMEILKQQIAKGIAIDKNQIDLIDIASARLAMRSVIAEEGLLLKGDESLAWSRYLVQTWGEIEEYYWRQKNAA